MDTYETALMTAFGSHQCDSRHFELETLQYSEL